MSMKPQKPAYFAGDTIGMITVKKYIGWKVVHRPRSFAPLIDQQHHYLIRCSCGNEEEVHQEFLRSRENGRYKPICSKCGKNRSKSMYIKKKYVVDENIKKLYEDVRKVTQMKWVNK